MSWELGKEKLLADSQQGVATLADCGFNTVAFVRPDLLPQCQKLKLKAIVCTEQWQIPWPTLNDRQIHDVVQKLVNETGNNPAAVGFFLKDEPGVQDFPALGKAVAQVKKLAPGKLAYINLFPNYATLGAPDLSQLGTQSYHEYLERFIDQVHPQFLSYDNYQVQYSNDLADAQRAASYFSNLLEVRRVALEHDLPFWNIVSANEIRPATPVPSPANLLLQAYTSLAAGAHGVTWYTYYRGGYHYAAIDTAGQRTATWSYLKMVNDQMCVIGPRIAKMKSVGVYFTSMAEDFPQLPGKFVSSIESTTPIMIGEFTNAQGDPSVMLVNLSLEKSTRCQVQTIHKATMELISPVDGSELSLEPDNSIWLAAGQGALLKIITTEKTTK